MKSITLIISLFVASNVNEISQDCYIEETRTIYKNSNVSIPLYRDVNLQFGKTISGEITIEIYTVQGRLATSTTLNVDKKNDIELGADFFGDASHYSIFIMGENIDMLINTERMLIDKCIPDYVYHIE